VSAQALSLISLLANIVLGGGLLAVILNHRVRMRGEERTDFDAINEALKTQRDEAITRGREQDEKIERLEAEINGLRIARDLDPFPNWVVDLQGCYRFVNREFEAYFLEPNKQTYRDIIGKRHEDVWPESFCKTLKNLDAAARTRPDGTARAVVRVDVPRLGACDVAIHKFPIRFKGAIVAMAGYLTSLEPVEQRL
jgi:hypothetical protein